MQDQDEAELALLKHLALIGELSNRRDQMQMELTALCQAIERARAKQPELVQAVHAVGGELPTWQV